jgi:hypothetical protein
MELVICWRAVERPTICIVIGIIVVISIVVLNTIVLFLLGMVRGIGMGNGSFLRIKWDFRYSIRGVKHRVFYSFLLLPSSFTVLGTDDDLEHTRYYPSLAS